MNDITALAQRMKAAAEKAIADEGQTWWSEEQLASDYGLSLHPADAKFIALASHENVLALVEALEKAQQAANINNQWKPDVCPITGRKFFMWIEHPELGCVPTYGGPLDSYTIPIRDDVSEFSCERYDHDFGGWVDGECAGLYVIDEDEICRVHELEQSVTELREQLRTVELSNSVLESRTVTVKRVGADQMHRVCLEATRHLDKYAAMAREVNKLLGSAVTNTTAAQPVTVRMPEAFYPDGDTDCALVVELEEVKEMLAAAGIQVIEGEGQ